MIPFLSNGKPAVKHRMVLVDVWQGQRYVGSVILADDLLHLPFAPRKLLGYSVLGYSIKAIAVRAYPRDEGRDRRRHEISSLTRLSKRKHFARISASIGVPA
jgi:hypothetical protein